VITKSGQFARANCADAETVGGGEGAPTAGSAATAKQTFAEHDETTDGWSKRVSKRDRASEEVMAVFARTVA
jgi:hypothetical protein